MEIQLFDLLIILHEIFYFFIPTYDESWFSKYKKYTKILIKLRTITYIPKQHHNLIFGTHLSLVLYFYIMFSIIFLYISTHKIDSVVCSFFFAKISLRVDWSKSQIIYYYIYTFWVIHLCSVIFCFFGWVFFMFNLQQQT